MKRVHKLTIAYVTFLLFVFGRSPARAVQIGSLDLRPCATGVLCGELSRPLDPSGRVGGRVIIHFRFYPARSGRAADDTIVTVEGGPGYPSIGSSNAYLALFGPLRDTHNMLIVDNRGTGQSGALDCKQLQNEIDREPTALAACGRQLGAGAYLYGSAEAADDLAAVIDALGIASVDVYGDSYGTFFGQTFAVRHPSKVRALVLDSAYPVIGESAWYPHQAPTARTAFDLVCARTPACAGLGNSSMKRIETLLQSLRAAPFHGHAPDGDGRMRAVWANASGLAALMIAETNAPTIYRELDPAARAYLQGDPLPLLRLVAEGRLANPENGDGQGAEAFSEALFVAVQCGDYPQLFDLRASPAQRRTQLLAALASEQATHPDVSAPFSIDEAQRAPYNDNAVALCQYWARPDPFEPLAQPIAPGALFARTPVLVLSGELDTVTTPAEGREAARLFPNSTWLVVPNSIHETAISDGGNNISPGADLTGCVNAIVLRFVVKRSAGNTSCLQAIRPIRVVPAFPLYARDVTAAQPLTGNQATRSQLRLAAAAVATAGDALNRYWQNYSGSAAGLRGGMLRITRQPTGYDFALSNIRYTSDLALSGQLRWNQVAGTLSGTLSFVSTSGSGRLNIGWNERASHAVASIAGTIGGATVLATCPAP